MDGIEDGINALVAKMDASDIQMNAKMDASDIQTNATMHAMDIRMDGIEDGIKELKAMILHLYESPASPSPLPTTSPTALSSCVDTGRTCAKVMTKGKCSLAFGQSECQKTCGVCTVPTVPPVLTTAPTASHTPSCMDTSSSCSNVLMKGKCSLPFGQRECQKTCGICG